MRVSAGEGVRRNANIEVVLIVPTLSQLFPSFCTAVVAKNLESWEKLLEFHLPIQQDTGGYDLYHRLGFTQLEDRGLNLQ